MSMLTDWLEWAIHPIRGNPSQAASAIHSATRPEYEALLACYRSGQMTAAQLQAHMDDDPGFEAFVRATMDGDDVALEARQEERIPVHH